MFRFCIVLHSADNSEVQLFRSKKCKFCPLWANTNTVEKTSKLLQKPKDFTSFLPDLCSFPSDKQQMCNSLAPCPREDCAVTRWKDASTDTAFWAVLLTATRDAVALLWVMQSVLALCMSLRVYAICGHITTMFIQSNLPLWFADQKKSTKCIIH